MIEAAATAVAGLLAAASDELLSSWINRHAAFYAVPPLVMLRHCLPEARSLRAADLHLSSDQEIRLANMFATEPAVVRRMTFTNVAQSSHRLIAVRPVAGLHELQPGTCGTGANPAKPAAGLAHHVPCCGDQLRDAGGANSPPLSGNIAMRQFGAKAARR
jgi:hypothetical protein